MCAPLISFSGCHQPPAGSSSTASDASLQKLLIPDTRVGDRRKVLDFLQKIHPMFASAIRQLLRKLDGVLLTGQTAVEEYEKFELEKEPIFEMVRQWKKKGKGERFQTALTDLIPTGRNSSSIVTYLFYIGKRLLPYLRHHFSTDRPDFLLTDLIAFGESRFVRITEDIIEACNDALGESAAAKKALLSSWEVLFHSIELKAKNSINEVNEDKIRSIREWYTELAKDVGPGITLMGAAANRERTERKSQAEEDYPMLDEAIQTWVESDARSEQKGTLQQMATFLRSGEQDDVDVSPSAYAALAEFMITELSIYFPLRIGAIVRMTVRGFLQAKLAWKPLGDGMSAQARPVTILPVNACQHQKAAKSERGKMGTDKKGERCCEEAVLPICYLMDNDQDKGGYSDNWVVISHENHQLLSDFLLVREHFFARHPPHDKNTIEGNCPIFLNSRGTDPPPTSNFKLKMFNKACFGVDAGLKVTSQDLRKWNTTYLAQHTDERVRRMRGAATGNSETVFDRHYNLNRQEDNMHCLLASGQRHRSEDSTPKLSQEHEQRKRRDEETLRKAKEGLRFKSHGVDLTSQRLPVHQHLKEQFKEELDRAFPGLWAMAGKGKKSSTTQLSGWAWIQEVLKILGRHDAEVLRDVIYQQYRGEEDPMKRKWSGLLSHIEIMKADVKGGKPCIR